MYPLFSILLANYNNAAYLQACLDSILAQTYEHWEVVLVDDGSTDDSQSIYKECQKDERIRIFYNPFNQGVAYTKKRCIDEAKGDIVGFLDPDDILHPEALSTMVAAHAAHPMHSIVYSTHFICDQDLQINKVADWVDQIPEGHFSWEYSGMTISHFASFKKPKYLLTEGLSAWFLKAVDKDLYYKLEETGPALFVAEPLYYYRHHAGSISLHQHIKTATLFDWAARAMVYVRGKVTPQQLKRMHHKKSEMAAGLVLTGLYLMKRGRWQDGWQVTGHAFRTFHWRALGGFWSLLIRWLNGK